SMNDLRRRLASSDEFDLSSIPTGINPFNYIIDILTPQYFIPLTKSTKTFLIIFFIFHSIIVTFCSVLLILPYLRGVKKSQWLVRRLYIKDHSGQNVYKAPLFWVNAGTLMTASQLMGSLGAQAFILIQILSAQSARYAVHLQLEPPLGIMFLGEMLTYWSLMHCFLVAIYPAKSPRRWTPSPTLINTIFLGFPIFVVVITIALFAWLCSVHTRFATGASKMLDDLKQGSSMWDQIRIPSTSSQDKLTLMTQLFELVKQTKTLRKEVNFRLNRVVYCFHALQSVLMVLLCITCLVSILHFFFSNEDETGQIWTHWIAPMSQFFVSMFWILVHKYQGRNRDSISVSTERSFFRRWSIRPRSSPESNVEQNLNTTRRLIDIVKTDRQFLHLLLRSFGMIVAMMTMGVLFLLGITRTNEVIKVPYWRGVAAWLATASGVWSAFPITWQCWRLYKDNLSRTSSDSTNIKGTSLPTEKVQQSDFPPPPRCSDSSTIDIKLFRPENALS
ncbi:hypothetical protein MJO28_016389, partial [Puccinia striiformis f. sp. tritici]